MPNSPKDLWTILEDAKSTVATWPPWKQALQVEEFERPYTQDVFGSADVARDYSNSTYTSNDKESR
jgi:hypothetical protein